MSLIYKTIRTTVSLSLWSTRRREIYRLLFVKDKSSHKRAPFFQLALNRALFLICPCNSPQDRQSGHHNATTAQATWSNQQVKIFLKKQRSKLKFEEGPKAFSVPTLIEFL
jgi:hypothetical protein